MGRHARVLFSRGYSVTGVDRDIAAIIRARELAGGPRYIHTDVRDYQPDACAYDLTIIMSQSFGYFDASTNRNVLRDLAAGVRESGRVILDLWNGKFFSAHQGERDLELPSGTVRETKRVENSRLFVHLDYPDGEYDDFEWELFGREQMTLLADSMDLDLIIACTDFDIAVGPGAGNPRIQFVLERRSA